MNRKRILASLGVSAVLAAGGVTAAVLGTTGISGAQTGQDAPTTTAPPSGEAPATPAPDGARPDGSRENCPEKGANGASGTATQLRFRGGGPRRA